MKMKVSELLKEKFLKIKYTNFGIKECFLSCRVKKTQKIESQWLKK